MTKQQLEAQDQYLKGIYAVASDFDDKEVMQLVVNQWNEIEKRLANMCYKCKENERDERYGEGSYCSQECWDSYYPQRPNWEESKRKIRERAKAKHTKGVSK
jgi:hypothetical protein